MYSPRFPTSTFGAISISHHPVGAGLKPALPLPLGRRRHLGEGFGLVQYTPYTSLPSRQHPAGEGHSRTEGAARLRTVSRCSPNTRAASRVLIPSTMQARRTRTYSFAAPLPGAHPRFTDPLLLRPLRQSLMGRILSDGCVLGVYVL